MDQQKAQIFEEAYDAYADSIFRYLMVKSRDRQTALDLTQETFVRAWLYLKDKDIENIRPFLYRVAHNLWCKEVRQLVRKTSLDTLVDKGWQPVVEHDIEEDIDERQRHEQALEKIAELDDQHREILVLRYIDDLSIGEIAEILEESENVISVRIHRAKKKLKSLYTKDYE